MTITGVCGSATGIEDLQRNVGCSWLDAKSIGELNAAAEMKIEESLRNP